MATMARDLEEEAKKMVYYELPTLVARIANATMASIACDIGITRRSVEITEKTLEDVKKVFDDAIEGQKKQLSEMLNPPNANQPCK